MRLWQIQEVSLIIWGYRGQDDILLEFGKILALLPSSVWQTLQPNAVKKWLTKNNISRIRVCS
jgi:hypothetical protein